VSTTDIVDRHRRQRTAHDPSSAWAGASSVAVVGSLSEVPLRRGARETAGIDVRQTLLADHVADLKKRIARLSTTPGRENAAAVLLSSDLPDKVVAGLVIAASAAAMGMEVALFCTAQGVHAVKRGRRHRARGTIETVVDLLAPRGPDHLAISRMYLLGVTATQIRAMARANDSIRGDELLALVETGGASLLACQLSMEVLGVCQQEVGAAVEVVDTSAYLTQVSSAGIVISI